MNRLESIKERLDNMYKGAHEDKIESAYAVTDNAEGDLRYLLQRLERYEKALMEVKSLSADDEEYPMYAINSIVDETLKE